MRLSLLACLAPNPQPTTQRSWAEHQRSDGGRPTALSASHANPVALVPELPSDTLLTVRSGDIQVPLANIHVGAIAGGWVSSQLGPGVDFDQVLGYLGLCGRTEVSGGAGPTSPSVTRVGKRQSKARGPDPAKQKTFDPVSLAQEALEYWDHSLKASGPAAQIVGKAWWQAWEQRTRRWFVRLQEAAAFGSAAPGPTLAILSLFLHILCSVDNTTSPSKGRSWAESPRSSKRGPSRHLPYLRLAGWLKGARLRVLPSPLLAWLQSLLNPNTGANHHAQGQAVVVMWLQIIDYVSHVTFRLIQQLQSEGHGDGGTEEVSVPSGSAGSRRGGGGSGHTPQVPSDPASTYLPQARLFPAGCPEPAPPQKQSQTSVSTPSTASPTLSERLEADKPLGYFVLEAVHDCEEALQSLLCLLVSHPGSGSQPTSASRPFSARFTDKTVTALLIGLRNVLALHNIALALPGRILSRPASSSPDKVGGIANLRYMGHFLAAVGTLFVPEVALGPPEQWCTALGSGARTGRADPQDIVNLGSPTPPNHPQPSFPQDSLDPQPSLLAIDDTQTCSLSQNIRVKRASQPPNPVSMSRVSRRGQGERVGEGKGSAGDKGVAAGSRRSLTSHPRSQGFSSKNRVLPPPPARTAKSTMAGVLRVSRVWLAYENTSLRRARRCLPPHILAILQSLAKHSAPPAPPTGALPKADRSVQPTVHRQLPSAFSAYVAKGGSSSSGRETPILDLGHYPPQHLRAQLARHLRLGLDPEHLAELFSTSRPATPDHVADSAWWWAPLPPSATLAAALVLRTHLLQGADALSVFLPHTPPVFHPNLARLVPEQRQEQRPAPVLAAARAKGSSTSGSSQSTRHRVSPLPPLSLSFYQLTTWGAFAAFLVQGSSTLPLVIACWSAWLCLVTRLANTASSQEAPVDLLPNRGLGLSPNPSPPSSPAQHTHSKRAHVSVAVEGSRGSKRRKGRGAGEGPGVTDRLSLIVLPACRPETGTASTTSIGISGSVLAFLILTFRLTVGAELSQQPHVPSKPKSSGSEPSGTAMAPTVAAHQAPASTSSRMTPASTSTTTTPSMATLAELTPSERSTSLLNQPLCCLISLLRHDARVAMNLDRIVQLPTPHHLEVLLEKFLPSIKRKSRPGSSDPLPAGTSSFQGLMRDLNLVSATVRDHRTAAPVRKSIPISVVLLLIGFLLRLAETYPWNIGLQRTIWTLLAYWLRSDPTGAVAQAVILVEWAWVHHTISPDLTWLTGPRHWLRAAYLSTRGQGSSTSQGLAQRDLVYLRRALVVTLALLLRQIHLTLCPQDIGLLPTSTAPKHRKSHHDHLLPALHPATVWFLQWIYPVSPVGTSASSHRDSGPGFPDGLGTLLAAWTHGATGSSSASLPLALAPTPTYGSARAASETAAMVRLVRAIRHIYRPSHSAPSVYTRWARTFAPHLEIAPGSPGHAVVQIGTIFAGLALDVPYSQLIKPADPKLRPLQHPDQHQHGSGQLGPASPATVVFSVRDRLVALPHLELLYSALGNRATTPFSTPDLALVTRVHRATRRLLGVWRAGTTPDKGGPLGLAEQSPRPRARRADSLKPLREAILCPVFCTNTTDLSEPTLPDDLALPTSAILLALLWRWATVQLSRSTSPILQPASLPSSDLPSFLTGLDAFPLRLQVFELPGALASSTPIIAALRRKAALLKDAGKGLAVGARPRPASGKVRRSPPPAPPLQISSYGRPKGSAIPALQALQTPEMIQGSPRKRKEEDGEEASQPRSRPKLPSKAKRTCEEPPQVPLPPSSLARRTATIRNLARRTKQSQGVILFPLLGIIGINVFLSPSIHHGTHLGLTSQDLAPLHAGATRRALSSICALLVSPRPSTKGTSLRSGSASLSHAPETVSYNFGLGPAEEAALRELGPGLEKLLGRGPRPLSVLAPSSPAATSPNPSTPSSRVYLPTGGRMLQAWILLAALSGISLAASLASFRGLGLCGQSTQHLQPAILSALDRAGQCFLLQAHPAPGFAARVVRALQSSSYTFAQLASHAHDSHSPFSHDVDLSLAREPSQDSQLPSPEGGVGKDGGSGGLSVSSGWDGSSHSSARDSHSGGDADLAAALAGGTSDGDTDLAAALAGGTSGDDESVGGLSVSSGWDGSSHSSARDSHSGGDADLAAALAGYHSEGDESVGGLSVSSGWDGSSHSSARDSHSGGDADLAAALAGYHSEGDESVGGLSVSSGWDGSSHSSARDSHSGGDADLAAALAGYHSEGDESVGGLSVSSGWDGSSHSSARDSHSGGDADLAAALAGYHSEGDESVGGLSVSSGWDGSSHSSARDSHGGGDGDLVAALAGSSGSDDLAAALGSSTGTSDSVDRSASTSSPDQPPSLKVTALAPTSENILGATLRQPQPQIRRSVRYRQKLSRPSSLLFLNPVRIAQGYSLSLKEEKTSTHVPIDRTGFPIATLRYNPLTIPLDKLLPIENVMLNIVALATSFWARGALIGRNGKRITDAGTLDVLRMPERLAKLLLRAFKVNTRRLVRQNQSARITNLPDWLWRMADVSAQASRDDLAELAKWGSLARAHTRDPTILLKVPAMPPKAATDDQLHSLYRIIKLYVPASGRLPTPTYARNVAVVAETLRPGFLQSAILWDGEFLSRLPSTTTSLDLFKRGDLLNLRTILQYYHGFDPEAPVSSGTGRGIGKAVSYFETGTLGSPSGGWGKGVGSGNCGSPHSASTVRALASERHNRWLVSQVVMGTWIDSALEYPVDTAVPASFEDDPVQFGGGASRIPSSHILSSPPRYLGATDGVRSGGGQTGLGLDKSGDHGWLWYVRDQWATGLHHHITYDFEQQARMEALRDKRAGSRTSPSIQPLLKKKSTNLQTRRGPPSQDPAGPNPIAQTASDPLQKALAGLEGAFTYPEDMQSQRFAAIQHVTLTDPLDRHFFFPDPTFERNVQVILGVYRTLANDMFLYSENEISLIL